MPPDSLTPLQWTGVGVLAAWFVTSVIFQFFPLHPCRGKYWIVSCLFPTWRLFAPDPVLCDLHLLVRGRSRGCEFQPWEEVPVIAEHGLLKTVFHPERYSEKTLFTSVGDFFFDYLNDVELSRSPSYALLLRFVATAAVRKGAEEVQFAIVESFGYHAERDPVMVFSSPVVSCPEV